MKTEDIIYRVNRGYTMSIYGSSQAIHEEMLKDITFLLENNKQLTLTDVSHRRELCEGNCGMNYCNENGCVDNKPDVAEPKPPEHFS
jgi:hypothetical protein